MVSDDWSFTCGTCADGRPHKMRLTAIALVLCACAWMSVADLAHLKAGKARLAARLAARHHKRGVLSSVPPFKLGYDIPRVTHSVVKPVVVTYPPTATVSAVKVPLSHPLLPRHPLPAGHGVPVPHPHHGLKFPHHKTILLPKPDQHFHHHHHHVAPRPVVPVLPAPVFPVAAPTAAVAHPIQAPPPLVVPPVLPAPVVPQPTPVSPPLQFLPSNHFHFKPVLQAPPVLPAAPAPVISPAFQAGPQFPYILRPGGAVQTSLFATYPRYPFVNFPSPLIPLSASAVRQIIPHVPQFVAPQGQEGVVVEQPGVRVHGEAQPELHAHAGLVPAQADVHLHAAQPELNLHSEQPNFLQHIHPGLQYPSPVQPELHFQPGVHVHGAQPDVHLHAAQPDVHLHVAQPNFHQPAHPDIHFHTGQPDIHLQSAHPDIVQHGGQPDLHFHTGQPDVNFHQSQPDIHFHQGQPDVHFHSPQPDVHYHTGQTDVNVHAGQPDVHLHQAQPDGHLQPNPAVDNNGWSPVPAQPNDIHPNHQYPNDGHQQFPQEQSHGYEQPNPTEQQYHEYQNQLQHHIQQQLEQAQYEQSLHQQHQLSQEYGAPGGAPAPQYGVPGAEGRSAEAAADEDSPQFHNHIPLGLQPPIDRPLEHFH